MKQAIATAGLVIIVVLGGWYLLTRTPSGAPSSGVSTATSTAATFYCRNGRTIGARFTDLAVALALSDGRSLTLPQTRSASGVRYEATTTGAAIVFANKGDSAYLSENGQETYGDCIAAKVATSDAPGYELYTDQGDTFSFAFPTGFTIRGSGMGLGPGWSIVATTSGQVLARIDAPDAYQAGTNLAEAWFTVGASSAPEAVASCEQNLSGNQTTGTPVMLAGVRFTEFGFNGAGAGNFYETTSYRTVRDGMCWAIEYTIHSGNIGNYPPGTVQAFDEDQVRADLDEIARSFRFLK